MYIFSTGYPPSEHFIYVSNDMRIHGYYWKPKGIHEQKSLGNTGVCVLFLAAFEIITDFHQVLYKQHTTPRHCASSITNMIAL